MEAGPSGWTPASVPDLSGKTYIVTGANSGIGFEAVRVLAARGARVVLTCRSEAKATGAIDALKARMPAVNLDFVILDLASLESVGRAAREIRDRIGPFDALVNNAGVMALPRRETADGFEMQLGTNHLGHFALTGEVLDLLAPNGRVVNVSSIYHRRGKMNFDDLMSKQRYDKWAAYAQSKLANLLFGFELQRRLDAVGSEVKSIGCHPGYASTNLQYVGAEMTGNGLMKRFMKFLNGAVAQSAQQGSWPTVRAVVDPHAQGGDYYGPDGFMEMKGAVDHAAVAAHARDETAAKKLWSRSETLTGVRYDFDSVAGSEIAA